MTVGVARRGLVACLRSDTLFTTRGACDVRRRGWFAMTTRLNRKLQYEDYARLPADGKRYEILDGDLYVTAAPSPFHQRLSKRFQRPRARGLLRSARLGRGVQRPDRRDPGAARHRGARSSHLDNPAQISQRGIEGAPLLVVEVLSPSTRARDRGVKIRRYAALGVAHYWIMDPEAQTIECLRSRGWSVSAGREGGGPRYASPPGLARSRHRSDRALALMGHERAPASRACSRPLEEEGYRAAACLHSRIWAACSR